MKMLKGGTRAVFGLACLAVLTAASGAEPVSHEDVVAFIEASGFEVCDSVANDPPPGLAGARSKHLLEVAKNCATREKGKATVLFAFEFDSAANRDGAVSHFVAAHEPVITESGSAWPIGERFAIFASGPAHEMVRSGLEAELERRRAAK